MLVLSPYPAGHAPPATVKAAERELHSLRRALSERNTLYCNVGEYAQILDEWVGCGSLTAGCSSTCRLCVGQRA